MKETIPFKNIVEAQIKLRGYTKQEIASCLGITPTTLYRKLIGQTSFKQEELEGLQKLLKFDKPEQIFFA